MMRVDSTNNNMSRASPERYRLSIEVNEEMKNLIESLTEQTGSSKADILRRAIALLKTVKDAEKHKEFPALIDEAGNVRSKLVGV